jgi:hypothetical protein
VASPLPITKALVKLHNSHGIQSIKASKQR